MLTVGISTTPDAATLDRWQRVFAAYATRNKRGLSELIAKKGRDLGIKLHDGFKEVQFGGDPKQRGLARLQLAQRAAAGRGTKLRPELAKRYRSARKDLTFSVRSFGQAKRYAGDKADRMEAQRDGQAARRRRAALWQKIVGAEVALRQSGIGVMAASFLMFRKRAGSQLNPGVRTEVNRTGQPLGSVKVTDTEIQIESFARGLTLAPGFDRIVDGAIEEQTVDMAIYLRDRGALALVDALDGKAEL